MAALVSGSNQALCSPIVGAVDESTTSRVDNLSSASAVESALDAALESASLVETKLEDLLSRAAASASARAAALTSVAQSATVLSDDASDLTTILESSATSAQALSARIRFLDKVLVSGTRALTRVDHVLTLRVCAEGAKTCLSAGDLGTAASHVHLYLSLDPDVRSDPSSLAAVAQMNQSIAELTRKVREKADAAVSLVADASVTAGDHQKPSPIVTLMSVVKLFVPIGLPDEGIARFSAYLVAQIAADADRDASALLMDSAVAEKASGETLQQPHSVALAQLFETVASYIHVSEELVVQSFGSQAFVTLIVNLQQQCDLQSEKILARYAEIRRLDEVDRAVKAETTNPRDLDSLLSELSVISQRSNSYFEFLRLRCAYATKLGQTDADSTVEIEGELQLGCLNRALKSSRLAKWTSDLAARYVTLEAYFMRANIRKAIRIDEHGGNSLSMTSTAVDDVFFVLQKVVNRALTYGGSVDALLSILHHVNGCMSDELSAHVRRRLQETEPAMESMLDRSGVSPSLPSAALTVSYLTELAKANIPSASAKDGNEHEGEGAKYDFFVALNNASVSAEYAMKFRANVEQLAMKYYEESFVDSKTALGVPLGQLEECSRALALACQDGLERIAAALTSHVEASVDDIIGQVSYVPNAEYNALGSGDGSFSEAFFGEIEAKVLHPSVEKRLTDANWDGLVRLVAEWAASFVESRVFSPEKTRGSKPPLRGTGKTFNALGGLRADRDVRSMSAYFAGKCRGSSVRDVFARLSQLAMLVNLESPVEIYDIWGNNSGGMTWRLSSTEVRATLRLRTEWTKSSIDDLTL